MKSVRILLIDVNRISLNTSADMIEYPLGLLYIASALIHAFGDKVRIQIESYDDRKDTVENLDPLLQDFNPDILGLRSLTMGRGPLHEIAGHAKKRYNIPLVIAGGPHATDSPEDVLSNQAFDAAVLGEGEITAVDLVSHYLKNKSVKDVQGIATRSKNGRIKISKRQRVPDPDTLPPLDYTLVDFQKINRGHVDFSFRFDVPHANIFTSRGCPYRCIYCHHIFGKKFRVHSPQRIMDEVMYLYDHYGITNFQIIDDIFNLDKARAMTFFKMVIRSGLDFTFSFPNGLRGDKVDKELIDIMWDAGVRYIAYAIETGSSRIQKLIQKYVNLQKLAETISLTNEKGIVTRGFFMLGFPTETEEEAMKTIEYAIASDLTLAMFFTVVYFPGTPLYQLAKEITDMPELDLGLEDDYVQTREGPYEYSQERLLELKLQAIRDFYFSSKRLNLSEHIMPNFYNRGDIDASILVNIISGKMNADDIEDPTYAKQLSRYFLIAERFSKKSGFFV